MKIEDVMPRKLVAKEVQRPRARVLSPQRFIQLVQRCPNRKEWGFCERCIFPVRTTETNGWTTEGLLDKTILNSLQLKGHIPINADFIKSVEILERRARPCKPAPRI